MQQIKLLLFQHLVDIGIALVDIEHLTKLIQPFHIHVTDGSQMPSLDVLICIGVCSGSASAAQNGAFHSRGLLVDEATFG